MRARIPALCALPALALLPAQDGPLPARPLAEIAGFASSSRLTYAGAPEAPHELEVIAPSQGRARLEVRRASAGAGQRRLLYRSGPLAFRIEPGTGRSEELEGEAREELFRQLELRRALMLWPEGCAWTQGGAAGTKGRAVRASLGELGSLVAHLGPDGRPARIDAFDDAGELQESFAVQQWFEARGRTWPRRLELSHRGQAVWSEEVESVDTGLRYLDSFFVPPDRRPPAGAPQLPFGSVQHLDVPRSTQRLVDLGGARTLAALLQESRRIRAAAREQLTPAGLELDSSIALQLSEDGRPTHALLRLAAPAASPPEGWTAVRERSAVCLFHKEVPSKDGILRLPSLAALRAALPEGSRASLPYLILGPEETAGEACQLVLPFEKAP